jgi:hypothetical protein
LGYAAGILVAVLVGTFARVVGFDRDRAFYPAVLVVIASYYVLFAVMGGSPRALAFELVQLSVFTTLAVVGFKRSGWLVVGAIVAHGLFDSFHGLIIDNAGMPEWWPAFCLSADVGIGAFLVAFRPTWLPRGGGGPSASHRQRVVPAGAEPRI